MADDPAKELDEALSTFDEVQQAITGNSVQDDPEPNEARKAELRRRYPALGHGR